jgi:hypothetical protein
MTFFNCRTTITGLILSLVFLVGCKSDFMPSTLNNRLVIAEGDTIYTFHILNSTDVKVKTEGRSFYHYYTHGQIHATQGAYNGKLLHGTFVHENRDHVLLEKGTFVKGRKTKQWMRWYPSGATREITTWQNGALNGKFYEYDERQELVRSGSYKNGELHGKITSVEQGEQKVIKYNNGVLVAEKVKKTKPGKNPKTKLTKEQKQANRAAKKAERALKKEQSQINNQKPQNDSTKPNKEKKQKEKKSSGT